MKALMHFLHFSMISLGDRRAAYVKTARRFDFWLNAHKGISMQPLETWRNHFGHILCEKWGFHEELWFRSQDTKRMNEVTKLLDLTAAGDTLSMNRLFDLVYAELRAMAVQKMASERPGHTLQPTALVHEAYLRLGGSERFKFENRAHFFAAAAEAMRRILVDSARRNGQFKRGGSQERVEFCETQFAAPAEDEKLLQVNEALDALAREDPLKAEVAKMRYFVGIKHQEIADVLGISEPTVRRYRAVARVRLFELIAQRPAPPGTPDKS